MKNRKKLAIALFICFVSFGILLLILFKWGPANRNQEVNGDSNIEAETNSTPETEISSESEMTSEMESESETSSGSKNESEIESGSESSSDSEDDSETELDSETSSDSENESETELDSETETESETSSDSGNGNNTDKKQELSYLEQCELDYVATPVKRTREEALEEIRRLSQWFPVLHEIYDNSESYPDDLIVALAGNPEMTDFAYGYLTRAPEVTGGFTEEELPENYPLFLQWDLRWGYMPYGPVDGIMGSTGCGPTCLSMAIYYLTGDTSCTPDIIASYSMEHGYYVSGAGTAWSLLTDYPTLYNLTSVSVGRSEARLKAELDKGNILICSVRPGDFTSGGHFIVIYGYDENGFKVNDPKCVYRSRLTWTYEQIRDDIKQTWSVGK